MILLSILATVGKTVLIILIVILVLIALLLFFPICYRISGRFEGKANFAVHMQWLFYLVFLRVTYDTEGRKVKAVLHILGIPIKLYPRRPKKEKKQDVKEAQGKPQKTNAKDSLKSSAERKEESEASGEAQSGSSRSASERFRVFRSKAASMRKKAVFLKEELFDSRNKEALKHLLSEGKGLLSHYKPRKLKLRLMFSVGDPAATGELTGVISMFPFAYRRGNRLVPDFISEDPYLRGKASFSGRIVLSYAVMAFIRLMRDKNIKRMLRHIKAMKG